MPLDLVIPLAAGSIVTLSVLYVLAVRLQDAIERHDLRVEARRLHGEHDRKRRELAGLASAGVRPLSMDPPAGAGELRSAA